jgi:hypothetical protein
MDDHHRILDRVRGWCLVGLCRRRYRYDSLGTQTAAGRRVGPAALVRCGGHPRAQGPTRPAARGHPSGGSGAASPERRRGPTVIVAGHGSVPLSVPEHAATRARLVGRRNPGGQRNLSDHGMPRVPACPPRQPGNRQGDGERRFGVTLRNNPQVKTGVVCIFAQTPRRRAVHRLGSSHHS